MSESIYDEPRQQALRANPADLMLSPTDEHPRVYGMLMETGCPEAVATLVSLADGSTSLHFSTGGGMIGGGEHADVARASLTFVAEEEHLADEGEATDAFPSPEDGQVRFQWLTFDGGRTAEALEQDVGEERHAHSPLFYAGQDVITQLRLIDERAR